MPSGHQVVGSINRGLDILAIGPFDDRHANFLQEFHALNFCIPRYLVGCHNIVGQQRQRSGSSQLWVELPK